MLAFQSNSERASAAASQKERPRRLRRERMPRRATEARRSGGGPRPDRAATRLAAADKKKRACAQRAAQFCAEIAEPRIAGAAQKKEQPRTLWQRGEGTPRPAVAPRRRQPNRRAQSQAAAGPETARGAAQARICSRTRSWNAGRDAGATRGPPTLPERGGNLDICPTTRWPRQPRCLWAACARRAQGKPIDMSQTHVPLRIQSVTAKAPLEIPGKHADCSIVGPTELTTRARRTLGRLIDLRRTHVNWEIQLATARGTLGFSAQHGASSTVGNKELTKYSPRARARASYAGPTDSHAMNQCSIRKPNGHS